MYPFEKIKTQLAVAHCTRCERFDILVLDHKLWCSWCGKECEVTHKNMDVVMKDKFEHLHAKSEGRIVDLNDVPVQPLRIPSGWKVVMRNHLFEIDPTPDLVEKTMLFNQTMLVMKHEERSYLLDVGWSNEGNFEEGAYSLTLYEDDYSGKVVRSFTTKNRIELVEYIETLLEQVTNFFEFKRDKSR